MEATKKLETSPEDLRVERAAESPVHRPTPQTEIREGRYLVRFAQTPKELEAALRLRFEVFNLELGEGLQSSFQTGLDRDEFDEACHHLIVLEMQKGEIIGTYRVQTGEMAAAAHGF
jgi:putative hemolysin